jgi:sirohydrochlorin ferrochelatase
MKALLVMAHGSPRVEANDDVFAVVAALRGRNRYDAVETGFLDVNQPDIPTAIEQLVSRGATSIVAVPYFLHTGKHVVRDLPNLLEASQQRHPDVIITMGDYLGHDESIDEVLVVRLNEM